jgi:REP element-mobilizing transposase RayT
MAWEHGNLKTDTNTYYNITFWTDGYFACSVGNVSEEMLKRYIENQG